MEVLHERCAGLDVHKKVIFVCAVIGTGRGCQKFTAKFGTFPHELVQLRQWLVERGVTHVLMESTGVYWMPIYDALEGAVEIVLGNAQHIMNVPGRKTDQSDAEWLARLLRAGLVKPSFVPPRPFRELRQLTRYRRAIVQGRASEQNRIEKHAQIAGIKISSVASKVFTVSGEQMMREIAKGNTDPKQLSTLARSHLRKKIPQLEQAFPKSISLHTQELLGVQLRQMDRLECTIAEIELKIAERVTPYEGLLARLDTIPGIDRVTATDVLAEIGTDMSCWETHRQIAAMAGVCPANYISAGKRLKNRSLRGNLYLKTMLVQAACSAINVKGSYFQAKFVRLAQRRGRKRALLAIAHALLVAIYYVLKRGETYREVGNRLDDDQHNERKKASLVKELQKLGYTVTLDELDRTA